MDMSALKDNVDEKIYNTQEKEQEKQTRTKKLKCGRKTDSENGEVRNIKILSTFTKSEEQLIKKFMKKNNFESKSSFFRKVILEHINNNSNK
jgi:ligand-binding sensor protein